MGAGESKARFRGAVLQLMREPVSVECDGFWQALWASPASVEDVFSSISPSDVRSLLRDQPDNLATVVRQAVAQLCQVVETPRPQYFAQALNCVRVLTRVLPFLFEPSATSFCDAVFWFAAGADGVCEEDAAAPSSPPRARSRRRTPLMVPVVSPRDEAAAVATGVCAVDAQAAVGNDGDAASSTSGGSGSSSGLETSSSDDGAPGGGGRESEPLAHRLIEAAFALMFLPGFTVDTFCYENRGSQGG